LVKHTDYYLSSEYLSRSVINSENFVNTVCIYKKIKDSHNRPGVAQRVPGAFMLSDFMTFGT
jgi:hypothetical protein